MLQNENVPYRFAYDFSKKPKAYPVAGSRSGPAKQYTPTYPRGLAVDTLNPSAGPAPGMFQNAADVRAREGLE